MPIETDKVDLNTVDSKSHQEDGSIKQANKINIALVGNPNVGKSVIFNYLTGVYVDVSNYPGTTIDISKASLSIDKECSEKLKQDFDFEVIDTPGVYGVSSLNDEEKATRDYVLNADIIINVVSAISLGRDLFLTKQLCDMGKPIIVALNQVDEAKSRKLAIDTELLSQELNAKIIETVAIKGEGLADIKKAVLSCFDSDTQDDCAVKPGALSKQIEAYVNPYLEQVLSRSEALMIVEGDEVIAARNDIDLAKVADDILVNKDTEVENAQLLREKIYQIRREEVNQLVAKAVQRVTFSKRDFVGKLLLNPFIGSIVAIAVLYIFLYQFLGIFVAGSVVGLTEETIMNQYFEPAIRFIVSRVFPIAMSTEVEQLSNLILSDPMKAIGTFLAGDYGVLTLTVTYLYGLLLPLVLGFYLGLAILEDSGYLPRLAVLVDGVLSKLGMNGRAIVPLILGGGCVTMATVTTRMLTSNKEKVITMALLGLTIPCSAQLGVIQGLLSNIGGPQPWLIWGVTLLIIFALVGIILNKLLPGTCGHFVSDIPPLRIPRLSNIAKKAYSRTKVFMDEATPAFFIAAALVAFLQVSGMLQSIIALCEPIISNVLLLPKETSLSFILGMVRRDFGAFGLLDIQMTAAQLITACLVLTLFVPCIATVAIMIKEKNLKTALAIWLSSWVLAFGFGGLIARLLNVIL